MNDGKKTPCDCWRCASFPQRNARYCSSFDPGGVNDYPIPALVEHDFSKDKPRNKAKPKAPKERLN